MARLLVRSGSAILDSPHILINESADDSLCRGTVILPTCLIIELSIDYNLTLNMLQK
jgi:hypothetical protein